VGKEKGYLTYGDVNDMLPEEIGSADDLDDLITTIGTRASTCSTAPSFPATRTSSWKRARTSSST
jgi:RNA polymerase primary sigma factor